MDTLREYVSRLTLTQIKDEKDASYFRLRALCNLLDLSPLTEAAIAREVETFKLLKDAIIERESADGVFVQLTLWDGEE